MSARRRRNRRRSRGIIKHAGAFTTHPTMPRADGPTMARLRAEREQRKADAIAREGQGKGQPPKARAHRQWAKHDVDLQPHLYGKRNATRSVSNTWGHYFLELREWEPGSFLRGKGLSRSEGKYGLRLVRTRRWIGYTDDAQYALAWQRAAAVQDIDVQMLGVTCE